MKILLLNDLYYLGHHTLESLKGPGVPPIGQPPRELATATDEVKKRKGDVLEVERDELSEAAEPEEGNSWFILLETRNRFKILNSDFRVLD